MELSDYTPPPLPDAAIQRGNSFFGHIESHWYEDRFGLFTVPGMPGDPNYWIETIGQPTPIAFSGGGGSISRVAEEVAHVGEPTAMSLAIFALVVFAAISLPRWLRNRMQNRMNR